MNKQKLLLRILLVLVIAAIGGLIYAILYFYPWVSPALERTYINIAEKVPSFDETAEIKEEVEIEPIVTEAPLKLPSGYGLQIYAEGLNKPRNLLFDSQGNLLVSAMGEGKVYALINESGQIIKRDLPVEFKNPHGLAIKNGYLYIAETEQVSRVPYDPATVTIGPKEKVFELPFSGGHYTRTIKFAADNGLYVSVGSSCNVCDEKDERFASILKYNPENWQYEVFARGLRNTVFFVENPQTKELWGTDNGRDWLGDFLPPEEINIIRQGKHYGWPRCYGQRVYDTDFDKSGQNPCGNSEPPIYELPAHNAPLGLSFIYSEMFPDNWQGDLLVALHGSWNRSEPDGYKVVRLDVEGNKVLSHEGFMTGFLDENGVIGRPVDLVFGPDGALYISDDKAGVIYRVYR